MDDLHSRPGTYHFRDSSRVKSASHQRFDRTGQVLLPGAYETDSFVQSLGKKKVTYGFQAIERDEGPKIGHSCGDKVGHGSLDATGHVVGWDATVHYERGNTQSKCSHVMFRLCDCCYNVAGAGREPHAVQPGGL